MIHGWEGGGKLTPSVVKDTGILPEKKTILLLVDGHYNIEDQRTCLHSCHKAFTAVRDRERDIHFAVGVISRCQGVSSKVL